MSEILQEFVDSRGIAMRVDRQHGVIRGVKILGTESRNGRTYLPEALREAARLYEETKVNVNHPKGDPLGAREYQDRIGVLRNVTLRSGEGLFADFHFNPKHALAEQLIWDAEHMPENVGFSHNVQARTSRQGDRVVVEAITRVQSVDLVADPATTRGLFESRPGRAEPSHREGRDQSDLTVEDLRKRHPDLVEALVREQAAERDALRSQVEELTAANALLEKQLVVRRLLGRFHLPDPDAADGWAKTVVSRRFVESLLAAPDEETIREMIEERARLAGGARGVEPFGHEARPLCRDQNPPFGRVPNDAKTFVEAIT